MEHFQSKLLSSCQKTQKLKLVKKSKSWKNSSTPKDKINYQKQVNNELFDFYNSLFKGDKISSKYDIAQVLSSIQIPRLTEEQSAKCEILISDDELICALKKMPKNKSPGNDGLTKEFYEKCWDD